jgi:hypothetical protein
MTNVEVSARLIVLEVRFQSEAERSAAMRYAEELLGQTARGYFKCEDSL